MMRRMRIMIKAILLTLIIYSAPMTVEYTADGLTYMVDNQGYEWIYEGEIENTEVEVILSDNGTPEIEDDIILAIK